MTDVEHYAAYDSQGRITVQASAPPGQGLATLRLNTQDPCMRLTVPTNAALYYVAGGALRERPKSTAQLEGNVLKGVPAGASVTIEGQVYIADGDDIELEFAHPGTYLVKVDAFPQVLWTGEYIEN